MQNSLLQYFLTAKDRVLYKQYSALQIRNFPLLMTSNFLFYLLFVLMFTNALSWQMHAGFGLALVVIGLLTLPFLQSIGRRMQASPEASVLWVLAVGLPLMIWWNSYFVFLLQADNIVYLEQFIIVFSMFSFIAIVTAGRFARIFVFLLLLTSAHMAPRLLMSELTGGSIAAIEILLTVLVELFFLRVLNEQISKLLQVEDKNTELLDALKQKNIALEQANASQSRYLSAASHDLRQPLHALALLTNDAQRKNNVPEIDSTLKKMELAIDSLSQSFNAMLNLSRLDAGVVKPQFKRMPIQRLLQRLEVEYSDVASEKNLKLIFHPSSFWVLSDEDMLYSILSNFISNALRYTQTGGVLIGTRRLSADRFKIVVYDTGSGVPSEKAQQIFNEYQRLAEAEQRVKGGVGLGLAISERMAKLLGAKLSVKSILGKGSAFGLILNTTEQSRDPVIDPPISVQERLSGKRVAIFDDDEMALESLSELLSSWKMDVSVALSSDMYHELRQEEGRFDVVISDYHLGLMDETGLDILRNAQLSDYDSPPICLLLTGDTRTELARQASQANVHLWYKPIRPARLRAYLNGLM